MLTSKLPRILGISIGKKQAVFERCLEFFRSDCFSRTGRELGRESELIDSGKKTVVGYRWKEDGRLKKDVCTLITFCDFGRLLLWMYCLFPSSTQTASSSSMALGHVIPFLVPHLRHSYHLLDLLQDWLLIEVRFAYGIDAFA